MIRILLDMAFDNERHYIHAVGLSTDAKPTTGIITGSKFVAVDTGAGYLFDETAGEWNENQQLSEAVAAYLDEHPEALDQAAIEAMFGDQLDGIESDIGGLKSAIEDLEAGSLSALGATNGQVPTADGDGSWEWATPSGGGSVTDVQVNGTSVLQDGVANVPIMSSNSAGVAKIYDANGITISNSGSLRTNAASSTQIKGGSQEYRPIVPSSQHESVFYGFAKAAGADMVSSSNPVGTYTDAAKSAISTMLNGPVTISGTTPSITALPGIQYICGEVATLDITLPASGCIDVMFQSGSTPTVLTVTPQTGQTVRWANGFDLTSLEANTTYEINVKDGLGVVGSWS